MTPIFLQMKKTPLQRFSKSIKNLSVVQGIQKDVQESQSRKQSSKLKYLNQSYVLHLVALWQVFIEQQVDFSYRQLLEISNLGESFQNILINSVDNSMKGFNTPKTQNIDELFKLILGVDKISRCWKWDGMKNAAAKDYLAIILHVRHDIAHKGITSTPLSVEINFDYMRHLYNLAYLTSHYSEKHVYSLSDKEYSGKLEIPYPDNLTK